MPTLEDITTGVREFGDDRYIEGQQSRQPEVDDLAARLEAALHPTPTPSPTVFGMSRPDNTPGLTVVAGYRTYLGLRKMPWAISQDGGIQRGLSMTGPGGVLWLSIKELAGDWLDRLLAELERQERRIVATADHEPYDNWYVKGNAGIAEFHRRQEAFEAVCAKHPTVETVTVLEGWHDPDHTPGYWEKMYRPKQIGWGADSYNPGIQTPKLYHDPVEVHANRIAFAESMGKPLYIGETGTGPVPGDLSGAGRAAWVKANRDALDDGKAEVVLWWNSEKCALSPELADVWLNG